MTKIQSVPQFLSPFSAAYWKSAAREVKSVRKLAICAVLIAIRVALKTVYIPVGESLSIYVGFLVNAVSGAVCGPVLSLISGAVCDIIGFLIAPNGPFMPVFTLIEMFCAFSYSICLYSVKITPAKLLLSKALVNIFGNVIFTSLALNAFYGKGVYYYMATRIAKNLLMLPVEVMLLVVLFNALTPALVKMKLIPAPQEKMKLSVAKVIIVVALTALVVILTVLYFDKLNTFFKGLLVVSQ